MVFGWESVGVGVLLDNYLLKLLYFATYSSRNGRVGSCARCIGPFVNAKNRKRARPNTVIPRNVVRPKPSAHVSN